MPANNLFAFTDQLLAWLLTYGIHSSLLLAAAWLVSGRLSPAVGESVWKAALVGGLFTASLQLALGHGALPAAPAVAGPSSQAMFSSLDGAGAAGTAGTAQDPAATVAPAAVPAATLASSPNLAPAGATAADWVAQAQRQTWTRSVASFWLLCSGALLLVLAVSYRRLRRRLADRTFITSGPVFRLFEGLLHRTGVARQPRLSRTGALQVPIAQGVLQPEICLPERALHLEKDEQESLLAHELAHLVRRDPTWLLFSRTLESLFFFQPLNFVARKKLQEIAELRCDDWAARSTGRPASLARCLTEVAGWGLEHRRSPVPAMATTEKGLRHRVCRLLQPISESRSPRWLQPALGAALLAFALIAPGVVPASEVPAPEPPEAPAAPEAAPEPRPAPEAEPAIASLREPRPEPVPSPESPEEPPAPPTPPKRIEGRTIPPTHVQVPEIRVPEVRVPEVHVPEIVVPEIHLPDMDVHVPEIRIPAFTMPEIQIPEIHVPEMDVQIPEIEIPDVEIPDVEVPDFDMDHEMDEEEAARSAHVQEMAYARMEAVTAELAAVEEQLTRAHGEALRGALAAVEGDAAPQIAAFQQQVMDEIRPHLAALERELEAAHREGNGEKAEAIDRARADIERSVRQQMQHQERYVEAARQAAHRYEQELAQRHGEASREHRERAQRELERVQEDLHRELEAQHEERARVMREQHERVLEKQHEQMEAARQQLEQRLEQKEQEAREREERALEQQQRTLEEQQRALEEQRREHEKRIEEQREAETAES